MPRPSNQPLQLPPTIDHPKVKRAGEEYLRLVADLQAEWVKLSALEERRHTAEDEDREAFGKALRAGKPDPGQKALEAVDKDILSSRRRAEALEVAVAESRRHLIDVVEANRAEWAVSIDAQVGAAVAAYRQAVEQVSAAHDDLSNALALAGWLQRFPGRPIWAQPAMTQTVKGLAGRNGDDQSWAQVLAALRDHGQPKDTSNAAAVAGLRGTIDPTMSRVTAPA